MNPPVISPDFITGGPGTIWAETETTTDTKFAVNVVRDALHGKNY